jgi:hypothetical protein
LVLLSAFCLARLLRVGVSWTAPAERSDDGAFAWATCHRTINSLGSFESGVALRLPPQSKALGNS